MTLSDGLTLLGLSLGTVGAVFLAYDVIYGPGKRWQAMTVKAKLDQLREFRQLIRRQIQALSKPPYTDQEIQKLLDDEEKKWGPDERELDEENGTFLNRYENRVVNLGAFGVILIVLAFLLQIAGVLVH